MAYDYHRLSPTDFEALAADMIATLTGERFERFSVGRDGGIDFRCQLQESDDVIIGQAKRYKSASQLVSRIGDEKPKLDTLKPARYILVVSCSLTQNRKQEIHSKLAPWLLTMQ